jgi:Ca-activated chloride channel homolog
MMWKQLVYLFAAPVVMSLLVSLWYRYRRTKKLVRLLCSAEHQSLLLKNFSLRRLLIKLGCVGCGLIALWLALLRPQGPSLGNQQVIEQARDVVIALDISRSMLAQDYQPNRLTFAKNKIKSLLMQLSSERVGLIIFSGSAIVQCPLTKDFEAFCMFLDALDAETLSSGTTALDTALKTALDLFAETPEKKNKLLIIATDGEDFSHHLGSVQAEAKKMNLHICALGIGTPEGAPIPLYDEHKKLIGHQKDEHGAIVMTRLDENKLATLAQELAGVYIHATHDARDIEQLHSWLSTFEKEQLGNAQEQPHEEYFMFFSATAFLLFLLEWIL